MSTPPPPPHVHPPHVHTLPDGRPDRPGLATAIAIVDFVAAAAALLAGVGMAIGAATEGDADAAGLAVVGGVLVVMGLLALVSGIGLLLVKPWGRTFQIVTSILGLCCLGLGTIVNALILAYMFQRHVALIYSGRRLADMPEAEQQLLAKPAGGGGTAVGIVVAVVGGVFVMIMVMGILAAIAVPNLLNAVQRGKQKRTMADIRVIATAMESHAVDYNAFPHAATVEDLVPVLVPTYAPALPTKDGWEHPYDLATTDLTYSIRSGGKDGIFESTNPGEYAPGATTNFNEDIVFANGEFVRYPEGTQQ